MVDDAAGGAGLSGEEELMQLLFDEERRLIDQALRDAFARSRELLVHETLLRLQEIGRLVEVGAVDGDEEWAAIESLSRLRQVVGGRFSNLKERWLAAGLPLKEHRGEKPTQFSLDERGWISLANWILKQGYEARLVPGREDCIFEVRRIERDVEK